MKIILVIAGVLALVVVVVIAVGYLLPVEHTATRATTLPASPDSVFSLISDVASYPSWRKSVQRVEVLAPVDGKAQFREVTSEGGVLYSVDESVPGRRRVTRIADPSLPFGGRWIYEIAPAGTGSTLRITEEGQVYNPVFRFMSRTVFPAHRTIETFLGDLGAKLGSTAQIAG